MFPFPDEVGVVDEIQMIRDNARGWAWTRSVLGTCCCVASLSSAFLVDVVYPTLGLCVDELHICGEASAIELVREMLMDTGEDLEVKTYKRLTALKILDKPLRKYGFWSHVFTDDQVVLASCVGRSFVAILMGVKTSR